MDTTNASEAEFLAAKEATGPEDISLFKILRGYHVDPYERWTSIQRQYGDVARYKYGLSDTFFISSAEGAKRILQDNVSNYTKQLPTYAMIRRLVGNGLLTSEGSFWLRQRRLAQPAFHRQRIVAMGSVMTAAAVEMAEQWAPKLAAGEPISMLREMTRLTLKVVGDALFGAALSAKAARVLSSWDVLNQQLVERYNNMRLIPPILPTRYDRDFRNARKTMFRIVEELVAEKRAQGRESDDLLSMLMHARDEDTGEQMTDAQLRDEMVTLILAGSETTAIALSWTWALLDHHPRVREKLDEELGRVLAGRAPTAADFPQLSYTKAVLEEAIRLYPPVYILSRRIKANDVVCGHRLYKGCVAVMSPIVLHRHPAYWENPDELLPERWMDPEAEKRRPRFAYLPFSGGPRQCIGNTFALMEGVLLLATLAQRFRPRLEGSFPKYEFLVTCRPAGGLPMRLEAASRPTGHASAHSAG